MDYKIFLKYIQLADFYKQSQPNIYFFLKDCAFQRIYKDYGNRFPTPESQNMFNLFNSEIQQRQWKRNLIHKKDYQQFLENIFTKVNFHNIDLESFMIIKILTENIGIFGGFDDLTTKRLKYINDKIASLKANPHLNANRGNIFSIFQKNNNQIPVKGQIQGHGNTQIQGHAHTQVQGHAHTQINPNIKGHTHIQGPIPQNTVASNNTGFDLPNAGNDKKSKKSSIDPEIARLNEIMRQQKLNSPIYITNVQPGHFYNPYTNINYIPKGVIPNIRLPIRKKDPNYPQLRAIIEKELILANQELDYHKIDMARNHLERAAYYLKNVID